MASIICRGLPAAASSVTLGAGDGQLPPRRAIAAIAAGSPAAGPLLLIPPPLSPAPPAPPAPPTPPAPPAPPVPPASPADDAPANTAAAALPPNISRDAFNRLAGGPPLAAGRADCGRVGLLPPPPPPPAPLPPPPPLPRGLRSSTFQLNLSRFCHKIHLTHPFIPPNTSSAYLEQPLHAPPIPQRALTLSRKMDECKPLPPPPPPPPPPPHPSPPMALHPSPSV